MRALFKIILFFIALVIVVTIHLGVLYLLPAPLDNINSIYTFLIIGLFLRPSGIVVWFAFFAFFIIDILAISPFGILLFSGTFAMLFVYWLYKFVFTNKSFITIMLISFLVLIFYRILYIVGYSSVLFILNKPIPLSQMMVTTIKDAIITTVVIAVIYMSTMYKKDRKLKKTNQYGIIS